MSIQGHAAKDHWSAQAYSSAADFVPKLTSTVLTYLDVQPNDHVLDIGCGDGQLTAQIAQTANQGKVLGLDSSTSFITTAKQSFASSNCAFALHDARLLDICEQATSQQWDKVFSNAALHWILKEEATRSRFFEAVFHVLKPQGRFVLEMGGHGNIAEVHAAVVSAMRHAGVPAEHIRQANPWYFPSPEGMTALLEAAGFRVEKCYLEYRPTKATASNDAGTGGIEGWIKLMCAQFLDAAPEEKRAGIIEEACQVLQPIISKEDGSTWLGYVRLRVVAVKL